MIAWSMRRSGRRWCSEKMDELRLAFITGRQQALAVELAALDDLLARSDEMYGYEASYYVQRRRAVITEIKALERVLAMQNGRSAHGEGPALAHGSDRRQRGPQ